MFLKWFSVLVACCCLWGAGPAAYADREFITVASTTSTQNSGLFDHLLPAFKGASGIDVRVVAVGTGAALRLGRAGDADLVLVHHRASEEAFVKEGFGLQRHAIMYNDFVIVGPKLDPAAAAAGTEAAESFNRIAAARVPFVSRGDDSGTHRRELEVWGKAGVDPRRESGTWYRETGSGMGATLNVAAATGAYALTDRATWLSFRNPRSLVIVYQGDPALFNEYGAMVVSPARHPHVKQAQAQVFVDWLKSPAGRQEIAAYRLAGEQLFYPR